MQAFCGQCGLLLPARVTACPRCGTAVASVGESEGQNVNDPTIMSALEKTEQSRTEQSRNAYGSAPGLVQGPDQFAGSNSQTQRVEQGPPTPYPEYYTPASIPPPPPDYVARSDSEFPSTQGGAYPGSTFPAGPDTRSPAVLSQGRKNRRALFVVLLVLFLVGTTLGATAVLFAIGPERVFRAGGENGITPQPTVAPPTVQALTPTSIPPTAQVPTPTPVPATPTPEPEQQARSVVDRYYTAINKKDYQTAYFLWANNPDSYQDFVNGFADTQHDDYKFGQILRQSDGTVQVYITLVATSTSSQQTSYQGYYIVGMQADGSWKIVTASMMKA